MRNAGSAKLGGLLLRLLLVMALVFCVWAPILRFFFPGYFDPAVPYHTDHFMYVGMHAEGRALSEYLWTYPRPLGFIMMDLLGRLGVHLFLIPILFLTALNAGLVVLYVERLFGRRTGWLSLLLFLILCFGNPQSYASIKEDVYATASLTAVLIVFHLWQSFVESRRVVYLIAIPILVLICGLTKETYFLVLFLFFFAHAALDRERRLKAVLMLVCSVAIVTASVKLTARVSPFIDPNAGVHAPYYMNLSPASVLHSAIQLGRKLVFRAPLIAILAILIQAARTNRRVLIVSLVSLCAAVAAILPNSVLPNHLNDMYAWLGAYFLFVPILLIDHILPSGRLTQVAVAAAGIILCIFTFRSYKRSEGGFAAFLRQMEIMQRRQIAALPVMHQEVKPGETSLVRGITKSFNPYAQAGFMRAEFGDSRKWTVIVDDNAPTGAAYTSRTIHAKDLGPEHFDHTFVFDKDGRLISH